MKKNFDAARGEAGFTLIEVMIAMTILTVGLMSIAVAQLSAIKVASQSKHLQDAMFLAREEMDTLAAIPPEAGYFVAGKNLNQTDLQGASSDADDSTRYTRQTVITPDTPKAGLARVVVTVIWTNANNAGRQQVSLTGAMRMY